MEEAVVWADMVMLNVPGTGHEFYLDRLKHCLSPRKILFMNPGHSGGALRAAKILGRGRIAEANTLSYIARKTSETEVYVSSSDKPVTVGVLPARETEAVLYEIQKIYPAVRAGCSVLESSLCNINAIFHPPGMVLNVGWIEHTGGDFRFYYDGITPSVAKAVGMIDKERLSVAGAYGLSLDDFCTVLYRADSTTKEAAQAKDPYRACQESRANMFIKAPESLDHRYMHEDISSGDKLVKADSSETYVVGADTATLKGVYNVNKGYAVFKRIEPLEKANDYCIIRKNSSYGLSVYDHIVLDAETVNEGQLIYR